LEEIALSFCEEVRMTADTIDHIIPHIVFRFCEVRQNISGYAVLMARMTYTQSDSVKVRPAAKLIDRAQAIMPGEPPARFDTNLER